MPSIDARDFLSLREIQNRAKALTSLLAWDWLDGSAEYGYTTRRNEAIFRQIALRPRVLRGIDQVDTTSHFLGQHLLLPLIIAPTGHLTQFHHDGEAEMAAGLEDTGTIFFISTQTRLKMSEIRARAPKGDVAFQVYFYGDHDWVKEQVREAEEIGVTSICVCVDSPIRAFSYSRLDGRYDARKYGRRTTPPVPLQHLNARITWADIDWLRTITKLPLSLKGIMTVEDAVLAIEHGADAVWLSNHGGRALECDLTAVEMLEEVRSAVGKEAVLIVDGGIRTGSDVVKCLALGADMVAIGRPIIYGLIADGAAGVRRTVELFHQEIVSVMAMCGVASVDQIGPELVRFHR
jgi:isopentenyl diphosphate isomerase/L-lactate dehydrogenase-like FMN-dependent dehydrogenase